MDPRLADLLHQFELERLELNLFRGGSRDIGAPQVFGGQVLGQALLAAYATVDSHDVHSLHAYFLRRGDFTAPIVYNVDRARDGHSFDSRRVTAVQHGEQIFNLSASFQVREQGLDHQAPMPEVPMPEELADDGAPSEVELRRLPDKMRRYFEKERPFEVRLVEPFAWAPTSPQPARQHVWIRAVDRLPDDDRLHRCLLAYVSDYNLLGASTRPHGSENLHGRLVMASIDHAMWFHRPMRVDEWLLYSIDSPSASGARGFARGMFFTRDGRLVASTAQEGLIRVVDPRG